MPRVLKQLKSATLRYGAMLADNVPNVHGETALYAYIVSNVVIDGRMYGVKAAVKKRIGDNIFWIHSIDCKKSPELLDLRS